VRTNQASSASMTDDFTKTQKSMLRITAAMIVSAATKAMSGKHRVLLACLPSALFRCSGPT
jgi:hypothetical protein